MDSASVSVLVTPTQLSSTKAANQSASRIWVYNSGAHPIGLGGPDCVFATSPPVAAAAWSPEIFLEEGEDLFGICGSGALSTALVLQSSTPNA